MNVCVIGLGRLGLPLAAALASRGMDVVGVDIDAERVAQVKAGIAPFYEPRLGELLPIEATTNLEQAVWGCDVAIVIVNTPSLEDGAFSAENVLDVAGRVGVALNGSSRYITVAIASTVMPGTVGGPVRRTIEAACGVPAGAGFGLAYVPEFVALGDVVRGFTRPDFVLIGHDHPRAGQVLAELYGRFCENDPPVLHRSLVDAELAKIALNTYLTTKISFANQLAAVCERLPGADVDAVTSVLAADGRISGAYLRGGTAYGGPCFPRDDRALLALVERVRARCSFVFGIAAFNQAWGEYICDLVLAASARKRVGLLGLAFKPGTDCTTGATGMALLARLREVGQVVCWDELVAVRESLDAAQDVVDAAQVVVLTTMDPHWRELAYRAGQTVIDPWRMLNGEMLEICGVHYIGVGQG